MPYLEREHNSIYYEIHGTGFPLVLITGFMSDHSTWLLHRMWFSKHFKLIIADSRGSGKTIWNQKPFTLLDLAEDVEALLEFLHIEEYYCIGVSMGGAIAQELSHLEKPPKKLVLSNTFYKFPQRFFSLILVFILLLFLISCFFLVAEDKRLISSVTEL